MNRLIEFRAWHTPTGRLFSVGGLTDSRVYYRDDTDPTLLLDLLHDECILMQRTEFTDRFGKPLFEGDIVRVDMVQTPDDLAQGEIEYSSYQYVAYYKAAFLLADVGNDVTAHHYQTWNDDWLHEFAELALSRTLVGNLYQNPEIVAQTGCFALHPDHVREPHEV